MRDLSEVCCRLDSRRRLFLWRLREFTVFLLLEIVYYSKMEIGPFTYKNSEFPLWMRTVVGIADCKAFFLKGERTRKSADMNIPAANCPKCGSVYPINMRNMCGSCSAKADRALDACIDYLWKFPNVSTDELSEAIHVPVAEIYEFVKQGKLPRNRPRLTYPCECCGVSIRHNRLCDGCVRHFKHAAISLQASVSRVPEPVYKMYK